MKCLNQKERPNNIKHSCILFIILMQINIKVKFDKNNKSALNDINSRPFFLDTSKLNNQQYLAHPLEIHSFRDHTHLDSESKNMAQTHRRTQTRDILLQTHKKPSTSKKKSQSKKNNTKAPLAFERKSSQVKKNTSDTIKMPKKKISLVNNSSLMEEEILSGSLPGLSGKNVLQRYAPMLSENQKVELINQKTVFYLGRNTGSGEDDLEGTYLWKQNQQIGYRYQLLEKLGSGAFGEVVRAFDHKAKEYVAVKIIKSKAEHMQLALNEINILMKIKEKDLEQKKNILRIKDFIVFRKHICIITEILHISLFDLLETHDFAGLQIHQIRPIAIQILSSLVFLKENNIIHSDLKPENILFKTKAKVGIKLIDFGTSMFLHEASFLYIQSRFYRAPEIILGSQYDFSIDMWSFGCLLAELYLGEPIFSGQNQQEQLSLIMRTLGIPQKDYLKKCKNTSKYFTKDLTPKIIKSKDGKVITPSSKPLELQIPDKQFCSYLKKILSLDPQERFTPIEALIDPWVLEGLPQQFKKQHLKEMMLKLKKEGSDTMEKKAKKQVKSPSSDVKTHRKRNSDLTMTAHQSHRRRGSELG